MITENSMEALNRLNPLAVQLIKHDSIVKKITIVLKDEQDFLSYDEIAYMYRMRYGGTTSTVERKIREMWVKGLLEKKYNNARAYFRLNTFLAPQTVQECINT